jgi:hypothetical protein
MPIPICESCRERPAGSTLEILGGIPALTTRDELLIPAEPAQAYALCRDCAEHIWEQLAV